MKAWRSGRLLDYNSEGSWFAPNLCYLVCSGHGALNVKFRTLEYFTLYLRNRQSGNLKAIESCVCSIRSIERNMLSFLRTVYVYYLHKQPPPKMGGEKTTFSLHSSCLFFAFCFCQ
jgi:hypothetical protein